MNTENTRIINIDELIEKDEQQIEKYEIVCQNCKYIYNSIIYGPNHIYKCPKCNTETKKIVFTEDSSKKFKNEMKQLNSFINKLVTEVTKGLQNSLDFTKNICENYLNKLPYKTKNECRILQKYCWAFYCNDFVVDNFNYTALEKFYKTNRKNVDTYISKKIFTIKNQKHIFKTIKTYTKIDKRKFNLAIKMFKDKKYYLCSGLLFELIDSLIINHNLEYSATHSASTLNLKSQGWLAVNAFAKVYKDDIAKSNYSTNPTLFKDDNDIGKLSQELDKYVENINFAEIEDLNIALNFINLLYCLAVVYSNVNWTDKKPKLNRNWRMHGFYKISDITEIDCIKLFIILYCEVNVLQNVLSI